MPTKTFNDTIKDNSNTQAGLILGGVMPIILYFATQQSLFVVLTVPGLLAGGIIGTYARRIKNAFQRKCQPQ